MHVPVRVFITNEEFNAFIQLSSRNGSRIRFMKQIIENKNIELYNMIKNYTPKEHSIPEQQALPGEKPKAYDKKIINALKKIENNEKFSISVKDKTINSYQCFIDSKSEIKSAIFIIYSGMKNEINYDEDAGKTDFSEITYEDEDDEI